MFIYKCASFSNKWEFVIFLLRVIVNGFVEIDTDSSVAMIWNMELIDILFCCFCFFVLFSSPQSAVKAKLIELGSGTAGYIDDELPDYVMIMVANKRSKEQMIGDLSLFLGKNTDTFVNWLHQVLDKLQEVTLPTTGKTMRLLSL